MSEEKKKSVDNSRLAQAKRKLERLNTEFEEHTKRVKDHVLKTNGQPMNDKRGGKSWFKERDRLDEKTHDLLEEIKKQEERVSTLERQAELKAMGYNKYGGLDMTIENIPRIQEEIEKSKKGESVFSAATIKKYEKKLEELKQRKETSEKGEENMKPEVQALIDSGRVTQWKKNPTIYFVKGFRKVALELKENGVFEESKKYQATTAEEKAAVKELLENSLSDTHFESSEPEHFYRIEYNENDPAHGLRSYEGERVTTQLIEELKDLDNHYFSASGYYKFYFEEVKKGEVVKQIRMDLGDGTGSNQPIYEQLAKLCEKDSPEKKKNEVKKETTSPKQENSPTAQDKKRGYQKRTSEEIRNEVNALSQRALDSVKKHTHSPEAVKELLNFMSRFPERSFRNQVLIEEQFPGATACLGRAALQKQGIYIKKGEKGNSIFVRKTVRGFYTKERGFVREKEATPSEKQQIESGQLKIEQKPYYTIEKVFDVTQTQLKPEDYPKIFPNRVFDFELDEKGQAELQTGIQAVAKSLNIEIKDMKEGEIHRQELGQAHGAYVYDKLTGKAEIVLNSRNTPTQDLATSIHELAHAKMHKFSELDTPTKELQAEMTSYIVCKHFGMDTSEKAIPYISGWTQKGQTLDDKAAVERGKIMNDVSRVANEFIQTMAKEINQQRELNIEREKDRPADDPKQAGPKGKEQAARISVGTLWIDKKDGRVMEEDTGRTLCLKEAAFVEDSKNGQVILTGKSYGKEVQTSLPSKDFALGTQFQFPKEVVEAGLQRKKEIYQEQHLKQVERS
ncbi:hypothetical protein D920_00008 [Enterococcus faecalis 13-SD-W-01]|nr:hypothetical protein D920_00008 [Enterococcus faecalis 13-SD-W-01]